MLKILHQDKNPEFAIITPLLPDDKISRKTKVTIKRNKKPYVWASHLAYMNVASNFDAGISELKKLINLPPYIIKIDNDIEWNRNSLDFMVDTLNKSDNNIAYCYCSFEYKGVINKKFPADPFDPKRLMNMNYISSNSMFKTSVINNIPLVTDDKYKRLLDWAYFLLLLKNGYGGIPCQKGYFIAHASVDSISSGGQEDFRIKYNRVKKDFIYNEKMAL